MQFLLLFYKCLFSSIFVQVYANVETTSRLQEKQKE